ncbi:cache domain-containing sensor histidine kinase [Cohnella herbarum]|uniref:histidine kinase n=1 Tax=Cohnella herbarum TaxID=2728023 RepID=A0A7Z2VJX6_9BACL|nr:sensor histidine kinase [Cohnella herbarum]QJD84225.1 sensor histidine kinase [Cohnella herbarum]
MKRLFRPFRDLSIKNKMFISFLLILTVSSGLFIVVNSYITANDTEKQARYSLEVVLEQSRSFLNYKTSSIRKVVDIMVIHDTIQAIVATKSDVYRDNIGNWLLDEYVFNQLIYNVQTNPDIQKMSLYMRDGMASIQATDQFLRLEEVQAEPWMQRLVNGEKPYLWIPSESVSATDGDTISFFRKVPSPVDNLDFAGLLRAQMPKQSLVQILDQALFTQSTSALLINSLNELIASSSQETISDPDSIIQALDNMTSKNDDAFETVTLNGEKMLIGTVPVEHTDWRFVLVVPQHDIVKIAQKSRNQMLVIFLFVAAMTFPLAFWVSASGTIRIRKLTKNMRKVGVDNFKPNLDPKNNDEIGELTTTFNRMITRIDDLAADKYQLGLDVKNMELRALQAQINPHFLYNTLDMANWLAMKYNADDIRVLITSLSDFYKLSLSNGEDFISIRNEIEHVSAYVRIQNMRFRDKIDLRIDVPEDLMEYRTLKLLLQPLVENAILHGIMEKDTQTGTVWIRGKMDGDAIELIVEDDGIGMEEHTVRGILDGTLKKEIGGYGMRNIHNRLELIFGYPFGLTVESSMGAGTRVTVRIPVQETNEEAQPASIQ